MADFNAGAFYPLMGLFVILPDRAAWIATEVVLFSAIAVGMYVFLRALALSTAACILGAATFAFAGPVLSQVNHVDMTEGFVAIPWMLLAVLHIVRDGRWRWSIVLGIAYATVILAGAPEAMLDEALLVVAYRRHVGRPERSALVACPLEGRRRHGACPVTGGHPVVARSRGHSHLAAGERRARGGRELSHTVQHPRPGPLPRRRVRAPRRGAVLQPVQPARGRHLPGRAAAHRLDHARASAVAEPAPAARPPHLVRGRALRPPPRPRLEHPVGAPVQQPAALRPPAPAEPQHDHRGHRRLCPVRRLDRPHGHAAGARAR